MATDSGRLPASPMYGKGYVQVWADLMEERAKIETLRANMPWGAQRFLVHQLMREAAVASDFDDPDGVAEALARVADAVEKLRNTPLD